MRGKRQASPEERKVGVSTCSIGVVVLTSRRAPSADHLSCWGSLGQFGASSVRDPLGGGSKVLAEPGTAGVFARSDLASGQHTKHMGDGTYRELS